jgi:glycosyltransferase involved in cell wall biosynthesis
MKIGIDISQSLYEGTGVGEYVTKLVEHLLGIDDKNEYILFASSLRRNFKFQSANFKGINKNVKVKVFKLPPTLLDILWNRLHIVPIEQLIGDVDIFISSDWVQPPSKKAKKATILYDLIVYKYPNETAKNIVAVQKRRLGWVKKECDIVFCISESTKSDAMSILGIEETKLRVIYPGL